MAGELWNDIKNELKKDEDLEYGIIKRVTNRARTVVQSMALLLQNANFRGFFDGKLYQGKGKNVCVPGLNCYSCPGAVGACPIGSLQNSLSAYRFKFPYYVLGLLIFFGALAGRAICGFLCPFGFLQDILHQIPFPWKIRTFPGDRLLRKLKYLILLVMVILLPVCVKLTPFFCKYLCPSGTLAGILLAFADTTLFAVMGSRFVWKCCILAIILLSAVMIARPFCKYLCPLGAFYAPFNRISLLQLKVDRGKCIGCHACEGACEMGVDPTKDAGSPECIRCGRCAHACPRDAISCTTVFGKDKLRK